MKGEREREIEKTWDDQCLNQNAKFVKIPIKLKAMAELCVIWYGPVQQPLLRLAHCWQECEKKRRCPAILSIGFPVSPNHILSLVHIHTAQQRIFPFYRWDRSTPMDEADHKNEKFSRSTFHFFSLTKCVCRRMWTNNVHSVYVVVDGVAVVIVVVQSVTIESMFVWMFIFRQIFPHPILWSCVFREEERKRRPSLWINSGRGIENEKVHDKIIISTE